MSDSQKTKNITAESLFYREDEEKKEHKEIKTIPYGYTKVMLESVGRLYAPKVLHFRNYRIEELYELADTSDEDYLQKLVNVLNNMVQEDFDCRNLHEEDLKKILMVIYGRFWSKSLEGFQYYYDLEKKTPSEGETEKDIMGTATIPIKNIKTTPLNEEVKLPINITMDNKTVKFDIITIGTFLEVQKYINNLFSQEERFFSDFKYEYEEYMSLIVNKQFKKAKELDIDLDLKEKYEKYVANKEKLFIETTQALALYGIDDQVFETIEEKIEGNKFVESQYWLAYQDTIEKKCKFGIDPDVKFRCDKSGKEITRRFQFQFMDFIPSDKPPNSSQYDISFGG